jgi:hypothetical protein
MVSLGNGLSDESPHKYRDADGLFGMVMLMAGGAIRRNKQYGWPQRYSWLDITAGPGFHSQLQLDGTPPLAMKHLAKMKGIETHATFIDVDPGNVAALALLLHQEYGPPQDDSGPPFVELGNYRVLCGDNRTIAEEALRLAPRSRLGAITADPTGVIDFDLIARLATQPGRRQYDLLLYVSGTSLKRMRRAGFANGDVRLLTERMELCNKKLWIVRKPAGPFHWTWLVGTNWDSPRGAMPAWPGPDFISRSYAREMKSS